MKRRDKQKLRDFIDRVKAIKWPKIKAVNKSEQRLISTVLDAVNILKLEIICGNVLPELPEDSATYVPTAPDVELNLQIIKKNLYPLVQILRDLEPKKHKAALKYMRNLLDAVGYSWRIVPGDDAAKERDESWQRRRSAKELEARGALAAIVSNLAGNKGRCALTNGSNRSSRRSTRNLRGWVILRSSRILPMPKVCETPAMWSTVS